MVTFVGAIPCGRRGMRGRNQPNRNVVPTLRATHPPERIPRGHTRRGDPLWSPGDAGPEPTKPQRRPDLARNTPAGANPRGHTRGANPCVAREARGPDQPINFPAQPPSIPSPSLRPSRTLASTTKPVPFRGERGRERAKRDRRGMRAVVRGQRDSTNHTPFTTNTPSDQRTRRCDPNVVARGRCRAPFKTWATFTDHTDRDSATSRGEGVQR